MPAAIPSTATPAPFAGKPALLAPVLTPFGSDLAPDAARFVALCRALLAGGCDGLAVFGTTSEAASLSLAEKEGLLAALVEAGVPGAALMPGTGACSIPEAVALTRRALEVGAGGVLVLPPFYYAAPGEEGVFRYYAEVIERVGDSRLRVYLYHIPKMTGVPLTPDLVGRLRSAFGATIAGLKDSGGDWANTETLIARFPEMAIFPGSETFLAQALVAGGAGCISATANWQPEAIRAVLDAAPGPERDARDAAAVAVRRAFDAYPLIPALKAMRAERLGDPDWARVRPPLEALDPARAQALKTDLAALDAPESAADGARAADS